MGGLTVAGAERVWTGRRELVGPGAAVHTADGRVVAAAAEGAEVLDASGCVVVPGLVNAHHHLFQTAFRTHADTRHVPMATWLAAMRRKYDAVGVSPDLAGAAAAAGLAEALLCGVTTVADHHLTWPGDVDACTALAAATMAEARALGARLVFVRGTAGDDPAVAAASAEALVPLAREAGGPDGPDGLVTVGVGPAGVHADGRDTFEALADVARRHDLPRRTQANEVVDVAVAAERYGRRPLDLLAEWGWLAPDVTIAHLCGVTHDEVAAVADAGASATHAPGCDVVGGWGVAPVARLLDAGVPVGLGTSGGGSNDAGHLLADARLAMQVAPLAPPAPSAPSAPGGGGRPLTARDVLAMATTGSAVGLGRPDLGHLEPGAAADLCCYDVTGVADAGVADPVAGLVWASPGRRPRHVVVAGRVVVRDGVLVTADERSVAARLRGLLAARLAGA
jgi:8-oxoguanine deaminase